MHFFRDDKASIWKKEKRHTLLCILLLFRMIVANYYLLKMLGYPQFSFGISIVLAKICFLRIILWS